MGAKNVKICWVFLRRRERKRTLKEERERTSMEVFCLKSHSCCLLLLLLMLQRKEVRKKKKRGNGGGGEERERRERK